MSGKKKTFINLIIIIAVEFFLVAGVVWFFDPFYQYHEPFFGMEAVLNDRDNQMPGTIRNFQYDTLLVGSSVAENFDTDYLDNRYGCKALKVIRASGSAADLLYYVEMAESERELRDIFWCMDIFALNASAEVTLYGDDIPRYLHTKTVLDDLPYVFNKEVLFEKIPAAVVSSIKGINTGGQAYNWAADKDFSAAGAMHFYDRPTGLEGDVVQADITEEYAGTVRKNVELLSEQISAHPEIRYHFMVPPYSMLWWDCAWVNGQEEERFYVLEQVIPVLLSFDNVEVFYFQGHEEIICNLDNYMDMIHYSPEINQWMLESMLAGADRLDEENWESAIRSMRELAARIHNEKIYRYY